jgi:hypothetical protein
VSSCGLDVGPDAGSPRQTTGGAVSRLLDAGNGVGILGVYAKEEAERSPDEAISGSGSSETVGREIVGDATGGAAPSGGLSGRASILWSKASSSSSCWRVRSFGLWAVAMASFRDQFGILPSHMRHRAKAEYKSPL